MRQQQPDELGHVHTAAAPNADDHVGLECPGQGLALKNARNRQFGLRPVVDQGLKASGLKVTDHGAEHGIGRQAFISTDEGALAEFAGDGAQCMALAIAKKNGLRRPQKPGTDRCGDRHKTSLKWVVLKSYRILFVNLLG